ncbi:hypothetical protein FOZ62_009810, partial [Perkinsus olseni]
LGVVVDCWCRGLLVCAVAAAPPFFLLGVLGDGLCLGGASNTFTGLGSAAAVVADALLSDTTASSSCGGDGAGSDHENFILQQQSRTTCSQEIDSTHHDVEELQDVERWTSLPPASFFQYDIISFLSSTMGAPYTMCRDSKVVSTGYRESLGGNACNVAVALHKLGAEVELVTKILGTQHGVYDKLDTLGMFKSGMAVVKKEGHLGLSYIISSEDSRTIVHSRMSEQMMPDEIPIITYHHFWSTTQVSCLYLDGRFPHVAEV